ncbi:hypothetical protein K7X08_027422 [Anisodus acutangulus]|uniref:non-specific serine/threonine protein kinase n=1 Tax=Anisodus acutangulus TaxID=402998 RepID=A0A9Q1MIW3_9SOLA|nr:hypothetical protein K7X08_027422 [Anisodus acutangulus]
MIQLAALKLEKFVTTLNLKELENETSDFSEDYLIGIGMLDKVYKAILPNDWTLEIKKLNDWENLEDEFVSEITTLGGLRHRNLLPLIGLGSYKQDIYCFGVVLLELVTGKEPHELTSSRNLFDHSPCLLDADRDLLGKGVDDLILQFLELACDCVKFFPNERPTMMEVYDTLKNTSQGRRDWIQKIPLSTDISSLYD